MSATKHAPERKSRSGSHVPNSLRGSDRIEIRGPKELLDRARRVAREQGCTLAQVLEAGVEAKERR